MFEIGGGRKLFLDCVGSGTPTILLEAGDENTGPNQWKLVIPRLSEASRTCTYDRAGLGQSDPATGCRELKDLVNDLDAVLAAAKLSGPYLLVGTSGGGYIVAGFAARHPDQVAGIVFVETSKALSRKPTAEFLPEIMCDAPTNVEHRDYYAVEHAAWDHRAKLGDFPLTVMTNDYGSSAEPNTDEVTNVADQRGWFVLSPAHARQVLVTSGHDIPYNDPELVIKEILTVLAAARAA
jgi:pimeloyl-ACP methyl ester carboxylesterase